MTDNETEAPEEPKKRAPRKTAENSVSEAEPVAGNEDPKPFPVSAPAVVGTGETDEVKLGAIKFKNKNQKKSLSVHHLQRRLNELGYTEAYADTDGYYGDLTAAGVARFQKDQGFEVTGRVDQGTLTKIFENDGNVSLTLF